MVEFAPYFRVFLGNDAIFLRLPAVRRDRAPQKSRQGLDKPALLLYNKEKRDIGWNDSYDTNDLQYLRCKLHL